MFGTIDYVTDLITQGRVLFLSKVHASLTTAGYVYHIKANSKPLHYILEFSAGLKTDITYTRGVTIAESGDGTAVQLYNKHGGYGNDIYDIFFGHTPTASSGTTVAAFSLGETSAPGKSAESHRYVNGVIKQGSSDTITITPSATTDVEVYFIFWED
jgi:hypothetical protein